MPISGRSGLAPDGTCVTFAYGRIEIPSISVSCGGAKIDAEWVWKLGQQEPEDDTPGKIEPGEGSLKVSFKNFELFVVPNTAQFGAGNVQKTAVVTIAHPDIGSTTIRLLKCRVFEPKFSAEAGGKPMEMEMPLRYKAVAWGQKGVHWGNPTGTGSRGAVRF